MLNGRRLYYIILDAHRAISSKEEEIIICLKKYHIEAVSCGYVVFGHEDFLLRIWATETELTSFLSDVSSIQDLEVTDVILISRAEPWYRKQVEASHNWHEPLSTLSAVDRKKNLASIIFGKPGGDFSQLTYTGSSGDKKIEDSCTRFFIFAEEQAQAPKRLINCLNEEYFEKAETVNIRPSVYNFYSKLKNKRGMLIKLQAGSFSEGSETVHDIIDYARENGGINTATYISCRRIKIESEDLIHIGKTNKNYTAPQIHSKILANLVLTHDFDSSNVTAQPGGKERSEQFFDLFCSREKFSTIVHFHPFGWPRLLSRLRMTFKYVITQKNDDLRALIIGDYILIEREFRTLLLAVADDYPIVRSKLKVEKLGPTTFTMKAISITLNLLFGSKGPVRASTKEEQSFIKLASTALNDSSSDRNDLVHGNIINLFAPLDEDIEGFHFIWQKFVFNYIRLKAVALHALDLAGKLIQDSGETERQ